MSTTDNSMVPTVVPFDHVEYRVDTWYAIDSMGNERGHGDTQFEAMRGFLASIGVSDFVRPLNRRVPRLAECGHAPRGAGARFTMRHTGGWFSMDPQTPYVQEYKDTMFAGSREIGCRFLQVAHLLMLCPGDELHRLALFSPVLAYFRPAMIQSLQNILNNSGRYFERIDAGRGRYAFTREGHGAATDCATQGNGADLALRISDVYVFTRLHQGQEISVRADPEDRSLRITVGDEPKEGTETLLMLRNDGVRGLKHEDSTAGVLDWIVCGEYTWQRYSRY